MKSTRFCRVRPGEIFIHINDLYIRTSEDNAASVNLKTGRATSAIRPHARVTQIKLDLSVIDANGARIANIPLESL